MTQLEWILLFCLAVASALQKENETTSNICTYKRKYYTVTNDEIRKVPITRNVSECCKGYVNETGVCRKAPCDFGYYGNNCTEICPCKKDQYKICTMKGECICKDGWIGENCSEGDEVLIDNKGRRIIIKSNENGDLYRIRIEGVYFEVDLPSDRLSLPRVGPDVNKCQGDEHVSVACKDSKFGSNCELDCYCSNNATCDHITGKCNCSSIRGWTGDRCENKCSSTSYGPDCGIQCNCSNDEVCDHETGNCSCEAGKTGHDCSQNCSHMQYGINCEQKCTCDYEGTKYCDAVNGSCECRDGWIGSTCSEDCKYGQYGKDCTQNCTCSETELCNKENGSCQLADVCVANNTKNCNANISVVTCASFRNHCNNKDQINTKSGFEKTTTDLCCSDSNQDFSICISLGNCSCYEIANGTRCEVVAQSTNSHQPSTRELDDEGGSAVVPAAVTTTVVILTVVVVVIVVVIKRQRNKKRRPPVVRNQIYGASELDVVAGVIANDDHVTSSDTYDHVNRHNQRTDAKRNSNVYSSTTGKRETEYDVSSRVTRNTDVNRNSNVYSSTTDTNDNEYDVSSHVRRNRDAVRNSNIYSATTNTHESEYDVSSHLVEHSSLMNGDDAYSCDHLVRGDNVGDGDTDMYDHMTRNVEEENYNTLENHI